MPNRICTVDGCGKPHNCHGYCKYHDRRLRMYGDPLAMRKDRRLPYILAMASDDAGVTAPALESFTGSTGTAARQSLAYWRKHGLLTSDPEARTKKGCPRVYRITPAGRKRMAQIPARYFEAAPMAGAPEADSLTVALGYQVVRPDSTRARIYVDAEMRWPLRPKVTP